MKHILLVLLAGCAVDQLPAPALPPVVTAMTPATGMYGDMVTITGTNFGATGGVAFALPEGTADVDPVISWSDTQIVARVPFPANAGAIHIQAANGETDTDVFTPITPWVAGDSVVLPNILDAQPTAAGAAVLGYDSQVELVEFTGGHATMTPIAGVTASTDDRQPIAARLTLDAQNAPVVFATTQQGSIVEIVAGQPVQTGLSGTVIAAGHDAMGPYVWYRATGSLSRARPGTTFTVDRGPITDDGTLDAQVTADGTLVIAHSVDSGMIFDAEAYLGIERLAPGASAFTLPETCEIQSWDDYVAAASIRVSPDGARMFARYSTQQHDETMDHPQNVVIRDATGAWTDASGTMLDGNRPVAYLPTTIAVLDSRDTDISLIPDIASNAKQPLPLWPADAAALILDGTTLRPLIRIRDRIFYPTPGITP